MVMLDILRSLDIAIHVCHVNYRLRGSASDMDEKLVHDYCQKHSIPYHLLQMNDTQIAHLKSGNLQDKARDYRYEWLQSKKSELGAQWICVAHHQLDQSETFIQRALRGAGLKGLQSMSDMSGVIVRPLLHISSTAILAHAQHYDVPYRIDQSNLSNDYDRNFIRNEVLKKLSQRWPKAEEKVAQSAALLSKDYTLLKDLVREVSKKWMVVKEDTIVLGPLSELREQSYSLGLCYYIFAQWGFNADQVQDLIIGNDRIGSFFSSPTHQAVIDRDQIIITYVNEWPPIEVNVPEPGSYTAQSTKFLFELSTQSPSDHNHNICCADQHKILWPLHIRGWQEGDYIQPLGMAGQKKKVSDILIDQKVPRPLKSTQLVIVDAQGAVIWIVGRKVSESIKYDHHTKEYLLISVSPV